MLQMICVSLFLLQSAEQATRTGAALGKDEAANLEQTVARTPSDLTARARLLGYYFGPGSQSLALATRIQARRVHILWLVRNQPEAALLMTPAATIDPDGHPLADPQGYAQVRAAWNEQVVKQYVSAEVLGNAARFFTLADKPRALALYARAQQRDPQNPSWSTLRGSVMAFAVIGIPGQNQNGFPAAASWEEANSDFAKATRLELESSNDVALLTAAATELMTRGSMAQAMARVTVPKVPVAALDLAETLLTRAQKLQPANPQPALALARFYQLRSMSTASESNRKELAQLRLQQLRKATTGLAPDDAKNADQFLTVARAAFDAGDLDSAEALATKLIEMKPVNGDSAANLKHHGNLILGRIALRRGNVEAAKVRLLDAGHIEGNPVLNSFGPNMTLAQELLERGERATVLQYFELCRSFWKFSERMDPWIAAVNKREIPNFGANLTY